MIAEFAGVCAEIICRFPENEAFFAGYACNGKPEILIAPGESDYESIQAGFDAMARRDGTPVHKCTPAFLERGAIHAQLAEKLVSFDVLLMHGSAMSFDGQALIFTAASGTGKSTHTRLWREEFGDRVVMINDDKPLLKIGDGSVTVYGSPWCGKHRLQTNTCAPLRAIVALERADANHIEPISAEAAFPVVFRQAYISPNAATSAKILELESRLTACTGFYRLGCNMDREAAQVCRKGIFDL